MLKEKFKLLKKLKEMKKILNNLNINKIKIKNILFYISLID